MKTGENVMQLIPFLVIPIRQQSLLILTLHILII